MAVRLDAAGNLIGRTGPDDAPAVLCGSHVDTVPNGGALDGALGVVAGIEVARRIRMHSDRLPMAFEVVAFADEEGAYLSLLGSRAMTGALLVPEVLGAKGRNGEMLATAMRGFGLCPEEIGVAKRLPDEIAAFFELHIEQGPILESEGIAVGVVESIVGLLSGTLTFIGEANHAGTTPLPLRRDAFRAAAQVATLAFGAVEKEFSEDVRLTFGALEVSPGASNVVPGRVVLTYEIRANSDATIDAVHARLIVIARDCAGRSDIGIEDHVTGRDPAAMMDPDLVEVLQDAARRLGYGSRRMSSGAGHDAQAMAAFCPSAMIFVPSIGGISHNPAEHTADRDVVRGATLLCRAVMDRLGIA